MTATWIGAALPVALMLAAPHLGFVRTAFIGFPVLTVLAAIMFFLTKSVEGKRKVRAT